MTIQVGQLIAWLLIGAMAGALAGYVVRGRGYGLLGNMLIGLVGAVIGGVIFNLLNINLAGWPTVSLADLLVAFVGAVILIAVARAVGRRT
jgi:uncharacterized membrane protein YeaQ/YmgE (transglycosylase-associated protein family)